MLSRRQSQPRVERLPSTRAGLRPIATLQQRVSLFSGVTALVMLIYMAIGLATRAALGIHEDAFLSTDLYNLLGIVVLGGSWLVTRDRVLQTRALALMDIASVAVPGLLLGAILWHFARYQNAGWAVLVTAISFIFVRALVVPSNPLRTLLVSFAGVGPAMVVTVAANAVADSDSDLRILHSIFYCLGGLVAIGLSGVGSAVIYGLRAQVEKARQLGQYTLLERLGAGGMGEVYRARHAMLRRPTAIKLLPPSRNDAAQIARFEREVQHTAELTHPNTVAIYDYGRSMEGVFYYAMELLEGFDLRQLVNAHGPLPPGRVIHVLRQVCASLGEAHARGLVHRDVKPSNIFLCQRAGIPDYVKVVDFGLVKNIAGGDAQVTAMTSVTGTPAYIAPETLRDPADTGPAADIYALGAVAWFMLTGRDTFDAATPVEIFSHHLHTEPTPPSSAAPMPMSPALDALVLQCLAKAPEARPVSVAELGEALAALPEAGSWSGEEAGAWWLEHGDGAPGPSPDDRAITATLEVDLRTPG